MRETIVRVLKTEDVRDSVNLLCSQNKDKRIIVFMMEGEEYNIKQCMNYKNVVVLSLKTVMPDRIQGMLLNMSYDMIIIPNVKVIDKYYKDTLNVKINKVVESFDGIRDKEVVILQDVFSIKPIHNANKGIPKLKMNSNGIRRYK